MEGGIEKEERVGWKDETRQQTQTYTGMYSIQWFLNELECLVFVSVTTFSPAPMPRLLFHSFKLIFENKVTLTDLPSLAFFPF